MTIAENLRQQVIEEASYRYKDSFRERAIAWQHLEAFCFDRALKMGKRSISPVVITLD